MRYPVLFIKGKNRSMTKVHPVFFKSFSQKGKLPSMYLSLLDNIKLPANSYYLHTTNTTDDQLDRQLKKTLSNGNPFVAQNTSNPQLLSQ